MARTSKKTNQKRQGTKSQNRFPRTSMREYELLVEFLENPRNLDIYLGRAAQGPPESGTELKQADAIRQMLAYIKQHVTTNHWDFQTMRNRLNLYKTKYKNMLKASQKTDFGVTEKDISNGITTVAAKLEAMCPYFERMNKLFGERENVSPSAVFELGLAAPAFRSVSSAPAALSVSGVTDGQEEHPPVGDEFEGEAVELDQVDEGTDPVPS